MVSLVILRVSLVRNIAVVLSRLHNTSSVRPTPKLLVYIFWPARPCHLGSFADGRYFRPTRIPYGVNSLYMVMCKPPRFRNLAVQRSALIETHLMRLPRESTSLLLTPRALEICRHTNALPCTDLAFNGQSRVCFVSVKQDRRHL